MAHIAHKDWELVGALKDRKCKNHEIARICGIPEGRVNYMLYDKKYGIMHKARVAAAAEAAAHEIASEAIAAVMSEPVSLQIPAQQLNAVMPDDKFPLEIPIRFNISVGINR